MKLKELLEQATPLPWIPDWGRIRDSECNTVCCSPSQLFSTNRKWLEDRALITHAVNMLPKLVEALENAHDLLNYIAAHPKAWETIHGRACDTRVETGAILEEANNIPTP
jgi:hypothetical protein